MEHFLVQNPTFLVGFQSKQLSSSSIFRKISMRMLNENVYCHLASNSTWWKFVSVTNHWQTQAYLHQFHLLQTTQCLSHAKEIYLHSMSFTRSFWTAPPGESILWSSARALLACPPCCRSMGLLVYSSSLFSLPFVANNILDVSASCACSAAPRHTLTQKVSFLWRDLTSIKTTDAFTCGSMDGRHAKHSFRRDQWDGIH